MRKRLTDGRTDGQRGRGRAEKTNAECDGARAKCKCAAAAVRVANYEFKGKIIALGGLARWRRRPRWRRRQAATVRRSQTHLDYRRCQPTRLFVLTEAGNSEVVETMSGAVSRVAGDPMTTS